MRFIFSLIIGIILILSSCGKEQSAYRGSRSCRKCHEHFYVLWESSQHGKAMQEWSPEFAEKNLTPCDTAIFSGGDHYQYLQKNKKAFIKNTDSGKSYRISYALGGKYVYYFLTPFPRGKLQTLPLGYDVKNRVWFDISASALRMHTDINDSVFHWTDRRFTFNTACYSCHVSQLSSEYSIESDTYRSSWLEAGINCETCHGPADKHNDIFTAAEKEGFVPDSMYLMIITQNRGYSAEQVNASCSYCHAKIISLTPLYKPGDTFFQHFDLITYENPDYYADGRDLGENYTYTSWLMSPCVRNSNIDCMHCHTSSGRYIQKDDPNASCLPCHADRVSNVSAHSFHGQDSPGSICINCHMPKTDFARMTRSDHSMRPPMPGLTTDHSSPNACNICHSERSAAWADSIMQKRYTGRFQEATRRWADILHRLRSGKHVEAEQIGKVLKDEESEVVLNSILRSLPPEREEALIPVFREFLGSPSALVRASVLVNLGNDKYPELREELAAACADPVLLVTIRAAEALNGIPENYISPKYHAAFKKALREYKESLEIFPDNEISHYNLGNFYADCGNFQAAASAFRRALKLRPDYAEAAINLGLLYYRSGNIDSAQYFLEKAVADHPELSAAQINLALLYSERGNVSGAITRFKAAYQLEANALSAYNLAILYQKDEAKEALHWAEKAYRMNTDDPGYVYLFAYMLYINKQHSESAEILRQALEQGISSVDIRNLYRKIEE